MEHSAKLANQPSEFCALIRRCAVYENKTYTISYSTLSYSPPPLPSAFLVFIFAFDFLHTL